MTKPAKNETELRVTQPDGVSKERTLADIALDPRAGAAAIVNSFSKPLFGPTEIQEIYLALSDRSRDVRDNKLTSLENMLTAQAAALNAIFLELARRSGANMGEYLDAASRYMSLALKAQGQCRATLETLAAIKNPPVVYARQANIAAGPQQVNNGFGAPARAGKMGNQPNELLGSDHGERVDDGAEGAPGERDPQLAPLGSVDGSADTGRKRPLKPKRVQRRSEGGAAGRTGSVPGNDPSRSRGAAGGLLRGKSGTIVGRGGD